MNDFNSTTSDELIQQLRRLAPAHVEIDPREAFFRAGVEAGLAQAKSGQVEKARKTADSWRLAIACTAASLLVTVPGGYLLGRHALQGQLARLDGAIAQSRSQVDQAAPMNATIVPAPHDSVVSLDRVPEERVEPPFLEQRTNSSASSSASANATFESAMRVDDANRTTSVTATERWISPLAGIAASTTLHRKSESILRASHASVILLDSSRGYFGELPVSLASLSLQRRHLEPVSQSGSQPVTMLVAGDLLSFASNQEAVQ